MLCHKRIISSEIQNFKKQKKKFTTLFSPQKIPQLRTLELQTIAQKLLLTLDQKSDKLQDSLKKKATQLVPKFGPNLASPLNQH